MNALTHDQALAAEFRQALQKGTGRATRLLMEKPESAALHAELRRACIENLVYDPQCEASRAKYLCDLIQMTGQTSSYREYLERYLRSVTVDTPFWDTVQVYQVLVELAQRDGHGVETLQDFVLKTGPSMEAEMLAADLVRLQGIEALLACVRRFSLEIEDDFLLARLVEALETREGVEAAGNALRAARRCDAAFDQIMCLSEQRAVVENQLATPSRDSLAKTDIAAGRVPLHTQIVSASQEEIDRLAAELLVETVDKAILAYLSAFRQRDFPGDPTGLFPLLASNNPRVAHAAASALARLSHLAIHSLAQRYLAEGKHDPGVRLLSGCHDAADIGVIGLSLEQCVSNRDAYHALGSHALDVFERAGRGSDELVAALLHLYAHTPCSGCRDRAVALLGKLRRIPEWMAEEGQHDAVPGIALHCRAMLAQTS